MRRIIKWWKRNTGHKYVNGGKGVISIFLVIMMLPSIILADFLIESARYHSAVTILDDSIDCSNLSVLADYDSYLQDRFGLLAVNNKKDISNSFQDYMKSNVDSLSAWNLQKMSAEGMYPLSDPDVLRKQVAEYSQLFAPTSLAVDALHLSDLISMFEKMGNLDSIFEMLTSTGKATQSTLNYAQSFAKLLEHRVLMDEFLSEYTVAHANFKAAYEGYVNQLKEIRRLDQELTQLRDENQQFSNQYLEYNDSIETKNTEIAEYQKKLDANEITQEEFDTFKTSAEEEIKNWQKDKTALEKQNSELSNKINEKTTEINNAKIELEDCETTFIMRLNLYDVATKTLRDSLITMKQYYKDAIDAIKECVSSNTEISNSISQIKVNASDETIRLNKDQSKLEEKINSTEDEKLKAEYEKAKKEVDDTIKDNEAKQTNEEVVMNKVKDSVNEYIEIEKKVQNTYDEASIDHIIQRLGEILSELKKLDTYPNPLTVDSKYEMSKYYHEVKIVDSSVLNSIADEMEKKARENSIGDILCKGGDILTSLFSTSLFFEPKLSAYIKQNENYVPSTLDLILNDISELMEISKKLKNPENPLLALFAPAYTFVILLSNLNFVIHKLIDLVKHIMQYVGEVVIRVGISLTEILNKQCDEKILITQYLIKNLSNRTDYKNNKISGKALFTDYSYSNVKFATSTNKVPVLGSLTAIVDLLKDVQSGGDDIMFCGAEMEYILVGSRSEIINQVDTFFKIYIIRLLVNIAPIMVNPEVVKIAATANIGAPAVYCFYILLEPMLDTMFLVNNKKIPIIKTKVYLTPSGVGSLLKNVVNFGVSSEVEKELKNRVEEFSQIGDVKPSKNPITNVVDMFECDYGTHLFFLTLIFCDKKTAMKRLSNLIALECQAYYGEENFRIDKTYTCVSGNVEGKFHPILPLYGIATDGLFDQGRKRMRGY